MEQFTASEVRELAATIWPDLSGREEVAETLHAFADLLEAREKAVPVAWRSLSLPTTFICDAPKNLDCEKWQPLYTHPAPADAERRDTMTPHELAKRIERGEKWKLADEPAPCQSQNAERLAEALHEFDAAFHKELADLTRIPEDDRGRINRSFVMDCVVGLRGCWDKLSATRAHCAQAVKALGSLGLTEEQRDAIRFRALCADYGDRAIRAKVRGLIDRLPVMSLSAARSAIDDLTRNIAQPKIGDFDARDSFTVHTNTTTLQQNAAEGAQAQPPAASVTDAMVGRAQDCLHDKGKDIGYYHMRAALEAALAAQENPNG